MIPFLSEKVDEDRAPVPQYIVFSHSFIPNREKLAERIAKDKVPYDAWEREGFLTRFHGGAVINDDGEEVPQTSMELFVMRTAAK